MDDPHPQPDAGDAACWLGRLCPECGALNEGTAGLRCWRCGRETGG